MGRGLVGVPGLRLIIAVTAIILIILGLVGFVAGYSLSAPASGSSVRLKSLALYSRFHFAHCQPDGRVARRFATTTARVYDVMTFSHWRGNHTLQASWYAPNGKFYDSATLQTDHVARSCGYLTVFRDDAALHPGVWRLRVAVDHHVLRSVPFTIAGHTTLTTAPPRRRPGDLALVHARDLDTVRAPGRFSVQISHYRWGFTARTGRTARRGFVYVWMYATMRTYNNPGSDAILIAGPSSFSLWDQRSVVYHPDRSGSAPAGTAGKKLQLRALYPWGNQTGGWLAFQIPYPRRGIYRLVWTPDLIQGSGHAPLTVVRLKVRV